MQLLLGLFFFSILLTTGSSMQCVKCLAINGYCSNVKEECPYENHVSMQIIIKRCAEKNDCKRYESLKGKADPGRIPEAPPGAVIEEATCSKAPSSFASFFPAFLGLFLMKLLF
ncbi:putative Gamma type PLA2 inhibitor protein [Naja naja]|nr:putative Gamma type PLA2 inhibitor protein [Naja naja]